MKNAIASLKARRIMLIAVFCLAGIFFCSCTKIKGKLFVIEGNYFNSRGMYNEAVSSYFKALEDDDAAPYAEYGLGSVYASLDDGKSALESFSASGKILELLPPGEHRELRYRIPYNTGVVLFGEGDFAGAAASFKAALEIDSGRIEAKRNLELSLLSLAGEKTERDKVTKDEDTGPAQKALFEYLRQREQNQWRSREWTEESPASGPDY
jgi:Ca-activated chloride channel family protein